MGLANYNKSAMGTSGKGQKGKGKGKGHAKAQGGGKQTEDEGFLCCWEDCRAARDNAPTWAGSKQCHCCKRPKGSALQPPLELMTERAYLAKLGHKDDKEKVKGKGAGKGGGKGKPADTPAGAAKTDDKLRQLRQDRLAGLKANGDKATPAPRPATATEEVAKVFADNGDAKTPQHLTITQELEDEAAQLSTLAASVIASLRGEALPPDRELPAAEQVLKGLLAGKAPFTKVEGRAQAEAAVVATKQSITNFEVAGTPENDDIMKSLRTRLERQTKALEAMEDKTPTPARCRKALMRIMAYYDDSCKEKTDAAEAGASKAVARAAQRAEQLGIMARTLENIRKEAEEAVVTLTNEHNERAANWQALNCEVTVLLQEKVDETEELDRGAQDEEMDFEDAEEATETEKQLEEAQHLADSVAKSKLTLQAQIARLEQQVASMSTSAKAPDKDNDPLSDLHLDFEANKDSLPTLLGTPTEEQRKQLLTLAAFFAAVPWNAQLPALTFHVLGALPSIIHGLTGDAIWQACWGERHPNITTAHYVPFKLLHVVKWIVEQNQTQQPDTAAQEDGRSRYTTAALEATDRTAVRPRLGLCHHLLVVGGGCDRHASGKPYCPPC